MTIWASKDPTAVLDYTYTIPLDAGDSVSSATLTVLSGTVAIDSQSRAGDVVTAWLSGGTDGETAVFSIAWTTAAGRSDDDIITLAVAARVTADGYVVPGSSDLKAAFPAFANVADATIQYWIGRAGRIVDTSWAIGDYTFAQMLLAAHYMVTQGLGTGAEATAFAQGAAGFKSLRSGSLSLDRFDNGKGGAVSEYDSTSYGQQFKALLRRNRGGPRVSDTGVVPLPPYPPYGPWAW